MREKLAVGTIRQDLWNISEKKKTNDIMTRLNHMDSTATTNIEMAYVIQ
jgi:hypothetical protein